MKFGSTLGPRSIAIAVAILPVSCSNEQTKLESMVESNRVGTSPDVWLEVHNMMGEWERLALIFGYLDDYSACSDIVRGLEAQFQREYRCTLAN